MSEDEAEAEMISLRLAHAPLSLIGMLDEAETNELKIVSDLGGLSLEDELNYRIEFR